MIHLVTGGYLLKTGFMESFFVDKTTKIKPLHHSHAFFCRLFQGQKSFRPGFNFEGSRDLAVRFTCTCSGCLDRDRHDL